jgi:uncharacterized protein YuzE
MTQPDLLVAQYLNAKTEYDKAKAHYEDLQAQVTKQMEADHRKRYKWNQQGKVCTITFVQQHQTDIDEPGLRKALTAKVFDRYTKRVLDRKAMELAMDTGEVDPVTVSRFVATRPKKPFLTYTEKEAE